MNLIARVKNRFNQNQISKQEIERIAGLNFSDPHSFAKTILTLSKADVARVQKQIHIHKVNDIEDWIFNLHKIKDIDSSLYYEVYYNLDYSAQNKFWNTYSLAREELQRLNEHKMSIIRYGILITVALITCCLILLGS